LILDAEENKSVCAIKPFRMGYSTLEVTGMAENQKATGSLQMQVDRLATSLDKARLAEYVELQTNTRRFLYLNFLAGVARGFGMAVGFTLVGALLLYLLRQMVSIPVLGSFIAQIVDIVTMQLGRR